MGVELDGAERRQVDHRVAVQRRPGRQGGVERADVGGDTTRQRQGARGSHQGKQDHAGGGPPAAAPADRRLWLARRFPGLGLSLGDRASPPPTRSSPAVSSGAARLLGCRFLGRRHPRSRRGPVAVGAGARGARSGGRPRNDDSATGPDSHPRGAGGPAADRPAATGSSRSRRRSCWSRRCQTTTSTCRAGRRSRLHRGGHGLDDVVGRLGEPILHGVADPLGVAGHDLAHVPHPRVVAGTLDGIVDLPAAFVAGLGGHQVAGREPDGCSELESHAPRLPAQAAV